MSYAVICHIWLVFPALLVGGKTSGASLCIVLVTGEHQRRSTDDNLVASHMKESTIPGWRDGLESFVMRN
jgi:hypothetical protein